MITLTISKTTAPTMKIKFLSKREINSLVEKLIAISLIPDALKIKQIKSFELNDEIEIFLSSNFILVRNQDELFPFLQDSDTISSLPKIVVDKGAIPFVCKGANIMRPGIKEIPDDFSKGDLVVISEETHDQNLAIGKTLNSSEELLVLDKGMVIQNLHFVGDYVWNSCKELNRSLND